MVTGCLLVIRMSCHKHSRAHPPAWIDTSLRAAIVDTSAVIAILTAEDDAAVYAHAIADASVRRLSATISGIRALRPRLRGRCAAQATAHAVVARQQMLTPPERQVVRRRAQVVSAATVAPRTAKAVAGRPGPS